MSGTILEPRPCREPGNFDHGNMSSDMAEPPSEHLSSTGDDDTHQDASIASQDQGRVSQSSSSQPEQQAVAPLERRPTPSSSLDLNGAMQSLTTTVVRALNLERDMFDLVRDVTVFAASADSLASLTFEVGMGPHSRAAASPSSSSPTADAIAHLAVYEILQLMLRCPHARLLTQTAMFKEQLVDRLQRSEDHVDAQCAVVDDEDDEIEAQLVHNIALLGAGVRHLEDLVTVVLPKWRRMMTMAIPAGRDRQKVAILSHFVGSILLWAKDCSM